eukprot:c187_g1_i1.p1 GENE.c187_g1_i1~~c187_g1_i1.p1  ORF type:complete len:432 (+),score=69.85 c187_g1_i1:1-1296(+)
MGTNHQNTTMRFILISCLICLICVSNADINLTYSMYDTSSCDGQPSSTNSQTIPYLTNCASIPLPSSVCGWDTCCDSPSGGNKFKFHCEVVSGSSVLDSISTFSGMVCNQLGVVAKGLCQKNGICVDSSPSAGCCGALEAWNIGQCDTTSITPSGYGSFLCSFKPSNANDYFNQKCQPSLPQPSCDTVAPALDAICGSSSNCDASGAFSPSSACCVSASALNMITSLQTCSAAADCGNVAVSDIVNLCQQSTTESPLAVSPPPEATATASPTSDNLTPCRRQHLSASSGGLIGSFIPRCEDDGSFSAKQCSGSTGMCWCVDDQGHRLGPQVRGALDCLSVSVVPTHIPEPTAEPTAEPTPEVHQNSQRIRQRTVAGAAVGGIICAGIVAAVLFKSKRRTQKRRFTNATVSHIQAVPVKTTVTIDVPVVPVV